MELGELPTNFPNSGLWIFVKDIQYRTPASSPIRQSRFQIPLRLKNAHLYHGPLVLDRRMIPTLSRSACRYVRNRPGRKIARRTDESALPGADTGAPFHAMKRRRDNPIGKSHQSFHDARATSHNNCHWKKPSSHRKNSWPTHH